MDELIWLRALSSSLDWQSTEPGTTRVRAWSDSGLTLAAEGTHYLIAYRGGARLARAGAAFPLAPGMFASVPGSLVVDASAAGGAGLVITHYGYDGVFSLGGPIEASGRLRYIDGCTDSLLLSPPVLGDPCLNHLHIPAATTQTRHVHPSVRVGIVMAGAGVCVTEQRELVLRPGLAFMIAPELVHSFCTADASLDVVVYHPDSDMGPTDEDHPMRNRTFIRASQDVSHGT